MTCTEMRERLLTADRAELRGEGEGDVATHVRTCAACAQLAATIESHTETLARLLAARPATASASPRWNGLRIARWSSLPIAAAIASVLFVRSHVEAPSQSGPVVTTTSGISVECKPGQTATVIPTKDPKITIIWLTNGGTE